MGDNDEDNRIFTGAQQEYLDGNKSGISKAYERNLRGRIRKRLIASLSDIQRFKSIAKSDRQQIFNSNKDQAPEGTITDDGWPDKESFEKEGPIGLTFAFMSFFEFYHRTMRENGYSVEDECKTIQYALEQAEQKSNPPDRKDGRYEVDATVEIEDTRRVDTEEALEDAINRYEEDGLGGVSGEELKALAEADYITLHGNWE